MVAIPGDFDDDGKTDVAFHRPGSTWGSVPMLLSNGWGSWRARNYWAPSWANQPDVVAVPGNFNSDGTTDIAFHRPGSSWSTVPVLTSNGNGSWSSFNRPAPAWANELGVKAIAGHFDYDGLTDLAFHKAAGRWQVPVLFSNGSGGWDAADETAPSWANQPGVIPVTDGSGRDQDYWQFKLETVKLIDLNEDGGDEPYFVVIGFQSTVAVDGSTRVSWSRHIEEMGQDLPVGEYTIPSEMGTYGFGDLGRLNELGTVSGALVIAFEGDLNQAGPMRILVDQIADSIRVFLKGTIEDLDDAVQDPLGHLEDFGKQIGVELLEFLGAVVLQKANAFALDIDNVIGFDALLFQLSHFVQLEEQSFAHGVDPFVFTGDDSLWHVSGEFANR